MRQFAFQTFLSLLIVSMSGCDRQAGNRGAPTSQSSDGKSTTSANRTTVDEYLLKWDQFAQGDKQLASYLRDNKQKFEFALAQLLREGDRGAPARLVFYPVVQVGGVIPLDSELGAAAYGVLGSDFPITTTKEGQKVFFSADLYSWWRKHETEFEHLQTFDEWLNRDFAKKTVLPMYERLQQKPR